MKSIIINMRNAVIIFALCWAGSMSAQIYSYDAAIEMPTGNIYDMGAMNSYLNAYRQSMAIKHDNWVKTMTVAMDYFKKGDYVSFINITNSLVEETTVDHFFELRGDAWSKLGYYKYALKEYKYAKRLGSTDVYAKINDTKRIIKQQKKKK